MELNGLDKFKLITYQNLDIDERNVLTLLYQPLLGCDAFTLYLTLWALIDRTKLRSAEYLHFRIYDIMRGTPKQFLKARKKLEAIGLLVAYHNDDLYLYELKAPLTAEEFIKDGSLGAYLFSLVGKENFDDLISMFRISTGDKDGFRNITTTFDDVFESLPKRVETKGDFCSKSKAKIHINHSFDFDVFLEGLSKNFVDRRKITKMVKDKISNLSYVYNLDEFTMQKVFMDSVDKNRNIDLDKLSINARKWFEFEKEEVFVEPVKPTKETVEHSDLVSLCKTEKPQRILAILSNGKPSVEELKVVERLIENYDLDVSVVNFMVVYVVGLLESFPTYAYFDKVAVEWQRQSVRTIEDAIDAIKKRNTRMKTQQIKSKQREKNTIPEDIESDWLNDYLKKL
jgi:replication initiation and membrane attachment protein